jgi:5-methylcytosine-specific restriction protein B
LRADGAAREEAVDFGFNDSPTVWKVSLEGTGDNPTRAECLKNGHIRIGWDDYGPTISDETDFSEHGGKTVLNAFITKMRKGDIVFSCYSATTIDAIGVITGDVEWHEEYDHYRRLRTVNWIAKELNFDIVSEFDIPTLTLSTVYRLKLDVSQVLQVLDKVGKTKGKVTSRETRPYVFIVDEINRGNVSKVFGELITLLEEDKRKGEAHELSVTLPYSGKPFSVPSNVYVIGTMNTADRSIALMDTALRRRFSFTEVMPDSTVLDGIEVEGVDIPRMLDVMNRRIELLYDREHTLGHAYFIPLKNDPSNRTIACLSGIFHDRLMPLLQEYFFDDYTKIASVLGAAAQDFLEPLKSEDVFWRGDREAPDHLQGYRIKTTPTTADAYARIYQTEREA